METFPIKIINILLLFCLFSPVSYSDIIEGKVVGIGSRGSLSVLVKGATAVEVIHITIDSIYPAEPGQPGSRELKELLYNLCYMKDVKIETHGTVGNRGKIGSISMDGQDLAPEILSSGYAWYYPDKTENVAYRQIYETARNDQRGIFSDPKVKPPWLIPNRDEMLKILRDKWFKEDQRHLATASPGRRNELGPDDVVISNPFGCTIPKIFYDRGTGHYDISHHAFSEGMYSKDLQGHELYLQRDYTNLPVYDCYTGEYNGNMIFDDITVIQPDYRYPMNILW